jgi:hypothetical protein
MKKSKGIISKIQDFMDTPRGKTILNYLYSWGAAVVILGTLFKLTHIAGANLMLFIGMGTEVLVFFFSAFERPYEVAEDANEENGAAGVNARTASGQPIIINGPIVAGGTGSASNSGTNKGEVAGGEATVAVSPVCEGIQPVPAQHGGAVYSGVVPQQIPVANVENISDMDKVTVEYIEQVRALNEAIEHISKQTEALGQNLEEMETLRRNLTGVNAIYEIQLRNASGQLNSIDQINEQTQKMAQQVEELNALYARMIEAMTTNTNRQQI